MPSLQDILSKMGDEKPKLKPTATLVRGRDGRVKVEREELLTSSDKEAKIAASIEAGKKRGESKQDYISGSMVWKEGVLSTPPAERNFPTRNGEVYEFQSDTKISSSEEDRWKQGEWMVAPLCFRPGQEKSVLFGRGHRSIKVATFNVWFDVLEWKKRTEALLDLLIQFERVDVICLQEVTPRCLETILQNPDIRRLYRVTDRGPKYQTIGAYGVAILVRKSLPVPNISWVSLPTGMGRSGLVASFETDNNQKLAIATVHLESLNSQATRAKQLRLLKKALESYSTAILVGDYNITATGPYGNPQEHHDLYSILDGYQDLWVEEHGIDGDDEASSCFLQGVTYDSIGNTMLQAKKKSMGAKPDSSRLDRVFCRCSNSDNSDEQQQKSSDNGVFAHGIKIIGDHPIGPDLFLSDHYGLAFEVSCMETGAWMIIQKQISESQKNSQIPRRKKSRMLKPPGKPSKIKTASFPTESLQSPKRNLFASPDKKTPSK